MENTKALEADLGEELKFGGPRGSLKGEAGKTEDRRHRAFYHTLSDSEAKLQFFAARQIACRILGSHGYLCEHCWLPNEDCICEALVTGSLWQHVRLWVYMHPKDFLRKNNTGKLLWQTLGKQVQLCVCGIQLQEDLMWAALQQIRVHGSRLSPVQFSRRVERCPQRWNGRIAMLGFLGLVVTELFTHSDWLGWTLYSKPTPASNQKDSPEISFAKLYNTEGTTYCKEEPYCKLTAMAATLM